MYTIDDPKLRTIFTPYDRNTARLKLYELIEWAIDERQADLRFAHVLDFASPHPSYGISFTDVTTYIEDVLNEDAPARTNYTIDPDKFHVIVETWDA